MSAVSVDFEQFSAGDLVTGTDLVLRDDDGTPGGSAQFLLANSVVGTVDTGLGLPPRVAADSDGKYLGPGYAVLVDGDLRAQGPVTRVSIVVDLAANGLARIVLPYAERTAGGGFQFMELEVARLADGSAGVSIYLTDPGTLLGASPALHTAVARSSTGASATERGWLTAECGPRFLRGWWAPGGSRFVRRTPDVGAVVPVMDPFRWGVLAGTGAKIRSVQTDPDPTFRLKWNRSVLSVDSDTPDDNVPITGSTARLALVRYSAAAHAKRRRSRVMLTAAGPGSTGRIADHRCNRLDPRQTLVPCPQSEVTDLAAATVAESVSAPAGDTLSLTVSLDPTGLDGGIGSGRANMLSGGELCLDINAPDQSSVIDSSMADWASDTGGKEQYQQISSRVQQTWQISAKSAPEHARRAELVLGFSGSARGVWCMPPMVPAPTAAIMTALDHRQTGPRRLEVSYTMTEL